MKEWEEISEEIDEKIVREIKIPKIVGGTRIVTKKVEDRIYMRTGVTTNAQKYLTKEMVKYAYDIIKSGDVFTSKKLKEKFKKEYSQGGCVFSMTGGILKYLGIAEYVKEKKGYVIRNNIL